MNLNLKRFIAIIMAIVTVFSAAIVPTSAADASDNQLQAQASYQEKYDNGIQAKSLTEPVQRIIKTVNVFSVLLTGFPIFDKDKITFKAEGYLDKIFNDLAGSTCFDGYEILSGIPLTVSSSARNHKIFRVNMDKTIPELQEKVNNYYLEGDYVKYVLTEVMLVYLRQIKDVKVYQMPISDTVYGTYAEVSYNYGGTDTIYLDLYYDSERNIIFNNNDKGMLNLGFNFDANNNTLYAVPDCWQRRFGFCLAYDFIAEISTMDYDTERIKFTYNNKDWMIQMWKGRYYVCPGAELGVYNRKKGSIGSYYDCASDDEMMIMSIELYHNDELLFKEGPMLHWWITGFKVNDKYYLPESLTMKGTIEFPTEEMATLFTDSANKHKKITAERDGVNVAYTFK